jgi:hypothetical protein
MLSAQGRLTRRRRALARKLRRLVDQDIEDRRPVSVVAVLATVTAVGVLLGLGLGYLLWGTRTMELARHVSQLRELLTEHAERAITERADLETRLRESADEMARLRAQRVDPPVAAAPTAPAREVPRGRPGTPGGHEDDEDVVGVRAEVSARPVRKAPGRSAGTSGRDGAGAPPPDTESAPLHTDAGRAPETRRPSGSLELPPRPLRSEPRRWLSSPGSGLLRELPRELDTRPRELDARRRRSPAEPPQPAARSGGALSTLPSPPYPPAQTRGDSAP